MCDCGSEAGSCDGPAVYGQLKQLREGVVDESARRQTTLLRRSRDVEVEHRL